ncbi:MAG: GNAT family N-acetyltransferase [Armatimonadetes bacterium]|nr:GNAT family N-acetyltransferase [Armatimonadota bacterium]
MSVRVRPYEPADLEGFKNVRQHVYHGGAPIPEDTQLFRDDIRVTVVEKEGKIVASANALDMRIACRGGVLRNAGVAAVGVLPEERSSGVGSDLMRGAVREYFGAGFLLSSLYPYRGAFYRRFGYEFSGKTLEIKAPSQKIPKVQPLLPVRQIPVEEAGLLRPCYETFTGRYNGMNLRNDDQWWRHLGREKPYTIYVVGEPVEAYVSVRLVAGFFENQEVHEFVWTTQRGYLAALSLIRSLGINQNSVSWFEPADSPFQAQFDEQGIEFKYDWPRPMWRAINVPECLAAIKPSGTGEVTLRVEDPLIPENEGPWRIQFGSEQVEVERADSGAVEIGIHAFSQALMGEPCFTRCLEQGRATARTDEAVSAMEALLPGAIVYTMDFF